MYIVITNPKNRLLTKHSTLYTYLYISINLSNYLSNFIVYIIMPKRNDYQGTKYAQILHVDEPIYTTKGLCYTIYWSICITITY